MTVWQRARGAEQKLERRQAIVTAAWEVFQAMPFQAVTMAQVAERLGLSKGTLYLYFKTKEELFLAVQLEQVEAWLGDVETDLNPWVGTGDTQGVLGVIRDSVTPRFSLIRLLAILDSVLERNVDAEKVHEFNLRLASRLASVGAKLEACLPFLRPGEGARFSLHGQALLIGMLQLADPQPAVERQCAAPGLEAFNLDYLTEVMEALGLMLRGLASREDLATETAGKGLPD